MSKFIFQRTHKELLKILLGMLIMFLLSCTSTKTYYLKSEDNGYHDAMISDSVYTITVKSKHVKDKKRLEDIFYLRAAEIAKENGYPFFYTVETAEAMAEMNSKAKPYNGKVYTIVFYQILKINGVVKLLKERPKSIPFQVYSTESAYQQREYLIIEKEKVFGKTTEVKTNQHISENTQDNLLKATNR